MWFLNFLDTNWSFGIYHDGITNGNIDGEVFFFLLFVALLFFFTSMNSHYTTFDCGVCGGISSFCFLRLLMLHNFIFYKTLIIHKYAASRKKNRNTRKNSSPTFFCRVANYKTNINKISRLVRSKRKMKQTYINII